MKRRELLKGAAASAAALAVSAPMRIAAQVNPTAARDARLLSTAREQLARVGANIWRKDIVGIADFGLHSSQERFHFVDVENERVKSFHVTHGDGSDRDHDGWLNRYSNVEGSHCTSRGAYMTRSWYVGRFGTSIRLDGLDDTNSLALPRAIVMHRAEYARPEHIARWGRLGRSNGCFAMGPEQFGTALTELGGGRLLFADSLGFAADGSLAQAPHPQPHVTETELLRPARSRENTFQRTNPGVY